MNTQAVFVLKDASTHLYLSGRGLTHRKANALRFESRERALTEKGTLSALGMYPLCEFTVTEYKPKK